jgi:tyrosyl-tRNA synthetase
MYYDSQRAEEAESDFDRLFIKKEIPEEIPEFYIEDNIPEMNILDILLIINFAPSKGEARRLVTQGGVSVNGNKVDDIQV